ncbi:PhzF family phenazine biosynthesis protein [Hymenobacter sp. NST-14]|uniref:PhzF family phenazine biosynthesis protein n=1 Tax=Hymenobacter piscis TaxID=2839984 RepID=UPI001C00B2A9|nr:PhzF family phenazine biosynthesis protein [Hymenobacter piscis]MBT9392609.1 PhzF family phenazine biosynthesis protein [Hymenobacter piscis]
MPVYPFLLVDAFTETALGGNPCAVVLDADDLTADQMQQLAREFNQSETAFVRRSAVAEFGVHYFTPGEEIPLAGHPTIATITALLHTGRLPRPTHSTAALALELRDGPVAITVAPAAGGQPHLINMAQRRPEFGQLHEPAVVLAFFGLEPDDLLPGAVVQTVSTGTPQLMVPLRDAAALRRAHLADPAGLEAYRRATGFFSSHLFCLTGAPPAGTTFARHFCTPPDLPEDPVTGSATGGMAAYLWHYGLLTEPTFVAEQGHWMGRPGTVQVRVEGPPTDIRTVHIGGTGVVIVQGELRL